MAAQHAVSTISGCHLDRGPAHQTISAAASRICTISRHPLLSSCYRCVCDSGSTARLPFSRNRKFQRHRLQLTPGHYTRGREALSPCSLPQNPGADGTSDTSRAHVPAGRATVLCMYDSTALTSPGGLPSPRPNEAFSRPSLRAGSRHWDVQDLFGTRCPPDACPRCMPTPKFQRSPHRAQIARSTTALPPPIRPPHKQVPDLVAVDASVLEAWTAPGLSNSSGLFCPPTASAAHSYSHESAVYNVPSEVLVSHSPLASPARPATSRPWRPRQGCGESRPRNPPSKQG